MYLALNDTNLVRLGGAGAVFPRLLVVLRICTPAVAGLIENVLSFELDPASAARGRLILTKIKLLIFTTLPEIGVMTGSC